MREMRARYARDIREICASSNPPSLHGTFLIRCLPYTAPSLYGTFLIRQVRKNEQIERECLEIEDKVNLVLQNAKTVQERPRPYLLAY